MKKLKLLGLAVLAFDFASPAMAGVSISVSESMQTMTVDAPGVHYVWPVSTAGEGYVTPTGVYGVERMAQMWYSKKYDNSPMPHSIFFRGGYAIHGTEYVKKLGTPASHGCVRLHPQNAAILYDLVTKEGPANTAIDIEN